MTLFQYNKAVERREGKWTVATVITPRTGVGVPYYLLTLPNLGSRAAPLMEEIQFSLAFAAG